ncbi:MAG: ANP1/MMN9/VAN1 family protein [Xanthobacteraceae bacterium]|nr:ANP1/MMN9/VAN1 family protein [Xanthobacteraceae bacterium]
MAAPAGLAQDLRAALCATPLERYGRLDAQRVPAMSQPEANVLILTPMKSASRYLDRYFAGLRKLTYPRPSLSLGILEGDSTDNTFGEVERALATASFRRVALLKKDFGFRMPDNTARFSAVYQPARRAVLARARNHLLFGALRDEQWVLWLDVDVVDYPADIVERLVSLDRDVVHPHCVVEAGGATFDLNAWCDGGRRRMSDLRGAGLVRLDAVGGTMLLVRADRHRDGLVFPPYFYGGRSRWIRDPHPLGHHIVGEIETEGLGIMAKDMGVECWGLPDLEIRHASD